MLPEIRRALVGPNLKWILSLGPIGWLPASGSWASGFGVWFWSQIFKWDVTGALGILVLMTGFGLWGITKLARNHKEVGEQDPSWLVWDEFVGIGWGCIFVFSSPHWSSLGLWVLFRIFDILKPGWVGYLDRQSGALGILGDDVIAGLNAGLWIWFFYRLEGTL